MVPDGKGGTILAGGYYNIANQPIMDTSVAGKERQFFSDAPDGTSLLTLPVQRSGHQGQCGIRRGAVRIHHPGAGGASPYGLLPSPIAVLTLDQDPATGNLSLVKYHNVDTSPSRGLWITCGASLSPWNTHLSSEEYEPDALRWRRRAIQGLQQEPVRRPRRRPTPTTTATCPK